MTRLKTSDALALAERHSAAGRFPEAAAVCRAIAEAQPDYHPAWRLWGLVELGQAHLAAAEQYLQRAIRLSPGAAEYYDNLSVVLSTAGRFEEALEVSRRALELAPGMYQAANNLAGALKSLGRLEEAEQWLRQALAARPDYVEALSNLGSVVCGLGRLGEAESLCRRAIEVQPRHADAWVNLGVALHQQRRFAEAEAAYRRAIALRPGQADAHDNLGTALWSQGRVVEAREEHLRALEIRPEFPGAHSHALWCMQYLPGITEAELLAAHELWERTHAARFAPAEPVMPADRSPGRRLRLGFVSADLGRHPVGVFLVRALENLDRAECEVVCYSDRSAGDELTARIRAASHRWCESRLLSDAALAEQIRADRIDVLFDLAGHTARNRLLVFARKPAPLQMSWIGYVGTTGLATMDYVVADRHQVPPESEPYYRERILRLPDGYVCYDPPAAAPGVGPLPARESGRVTFGSFNNPAKINNLVISVWAEILRRVPRSRLLLKYNGWDDAATRERCHRQFAEAGIEPALVELAGYSPPEQMPAEYRRVDIGLDPFPYSGGLTTCEALWMGVPVITWPGATFAGRHALGHLLHAGLEGLVAVDVDDYVGKAVALAGDWDRLARMRRGLREQVSGSPLCDGRRLSEQLLAALRGTWRELVG